MINIFEVFLPQLLRYPNPADPLNGEAAALLMREPKTYEARVKGMFSRPRIIQETLATVRVRLTFVAPEYVLKYASKEAADEAGEDDHSDEHVAASNKDRSRRSQEFADMLP